MATSTADGKDGSNGRVEPILERGAQGPGGTHSAVKGEPSPRLPHERDESSDSGTTEPREIMKQAATDIENGLVPTDRSAETDEVYRKTLRTRTPA